ncbi:enoyl-CoA hydratase/isomerase family protein [Mucilaginibacter sp. SP1R1]|uniref:enoyl-CoA hydratase/isomerase family protein n=1 Tax=Mucilaginibacter sp. SP1R1 TaxID=2723091 RepID=UPI001618EEDF|nr:enoyl-CoA hydratase/isomerase family protein [Mucilaginibacter sp. SP1R1]MBB6152629.1 enoyl-CoA hydratase/carnithine racemase [Mucilaginibacter sp. SP1R1]
MRTLQITINEGLATLTLNRGRSNPIDQEMVTELIAAIHDLENDDNVRGLLLTGKAGFFSSGIDLIAAYDYNREQSKAFWSDFMRMQTALASFKKPLVAAISGHSPAGGCVLAICCDYRVMVEGSFIIGLNEIPVGIIVPDSVFSLYAFWLGQHKAYQYLMEGRLFKVAEALEIGLVDEIAPQEDLITTAEKKLRTYMQFNPVTWSQSKLNLRRELIAKLSADQNETLNKMLEQWWSPGVRDGLQVIIQNLKSRSN